MLTAIFLLHANDVKSFIAAYKFNFMLVPLVDSHKNNN